MEKDKALLFSMLLWNQIVYLLSTKENFKQACKRHNSESDSVTISRLKSLARKEVIRENDPASNFSKEFEHCLGFSDCACCEYARHITWEEWNWHEDCDEIVDTTMCTNCPALYIWARYEDRKKLTKSKYKECTCEALPTSPYRLIQNISYGTGSVSYNKFLAKGGLLFAQVIFEGLRALHLMEQEKMIMELENEVKKAESKKSPQSDEFLAVLDTNFKEIIERYK